MGFFSKIAEGLKKTKNSLSSALDGMLSVFTKIDDELFEELEEILIMSKGEEKYARSNFTLCYDTDVALRFG